MEIIPKSDIDKNFGKVLKRFRLKQHMTQEQLSEKLGISLKYISRIENGNDGIKTQTLIHYMDILGITPNTMYQELMKNPEVTKNIEISEKVNNLSDEKKDFINSILDLLQNLN